MGGCKGGAGEPRGVKAREPGLGSSTPPYSGLLPVTCQSGHQFRNFCLPTDLPCPRGKSSRQKLPERCWQQAGHFLLVRLLIWGSLHSSRSECARPLPATQGGPGLFPSAHLLVLSEILLVGQPPSSSWVPAFSELREAAGSEKAAHGLAMVRARKGPEVQTQAEGNVQMGTVPVSSQGLVAPAHPSVICCAIGAGTL